MAQQMKHLKTSLETTEDGNEDNRQQPQMYAKDSLDRFGDDLFGILLSYLSLEDRFRCECVSKQFQRTVFESVVKLVILERHVIQVKVRIVSDSEMLAKIIKKLPNIQIIDFREMYFHYGITDRYDHQIVLMLNTFRDNCRHLRQIYSHLPANSEQLFPSVGPLMARTQVCDPLEKQSLIHCHRLTELKVFSLSHVFDDNSGQLLVKNLKEFTCYDNGDQNNEQLSAFVAHNQSLRSFDVGISDDFHEKLRQLSTQLSRLTQLRELKLNVKLIDGQNSLSESLRTIGLNCKQLQRLSLILSTFDPGLNGHTMDSLKYYHRLKRLDLTLFTLIDEELLEPLKLCHRLTHLALYLFQMSDNLVDNCHKHWPQLHSLTICCNAITDECLDRIVRLPALKTLIMFGRESNNEINLIDSDVEELMSKSPKLKTIELNRIPKFYYRKNP